MTPRRLSLPSIAAAMALAAGVLAGCGSGGSSSSGNGMASKQPEQIVAAAKAAADKAESVHVVGSIVQEGKPLKLDLQLQAGKGAKGRIQQGGLDFKLVTIGNTVYINGSTAFYKQVAGSAAAQLLQGKWLKGPATGSFASLAGLTNLGKLVDTTLSSHGKLERTGTTTIAGQQVVAVKDVTRGGTLYVAATGTPYPIELSKGGKGGGKIVFDRWNQPVTLTAPANAIDVSQLQSGH